jgi:hypothetical protein
VSPTEATTPRGMAPRRSRTDQSII